jgi:hypothetical protein
MRRPRILGKPLFAGLAVALVVFIIDAGLEYLLLDRGISHSWTLFISDAIAATAVAFFATYTFSLHRQREAEVRWRVERIVEMNHHVRNALQVITYWSLAERDKKEVELIRQAVDRIEWALREVLPAGLGITTPFRKPPAPQSLPSREVDRGHSTSA